MWNVHALQPQMRLSGALGTTQLVTDESIESTQQLLRHPDLLIEVTKEVLKSFNFLRVLSEILRSMAVMMPEINVPEEPLMCTKFKCDSHKVTVRLSSAPKTES